SSTAASASSSIGEPPSDQSEWLWQSPRSAPRSAAVASSKSVPSVSTSRRRYTGSSPASDSATQRAVTSPTPDSLVSVPAVARSSSSPGGSLDRAAAALRNAFTRYVASCARSSRNAMRRRSSIGSRAGMGMTLVRQRIPYPRRHQVRLRELQDQRPVRCAGGTVDHDYGVRAPHVPERALVVETERARRADARNV